MSGFCVMFCTAPQGDIAEKMARHLVQSRVAACVNIIPALRSIYTWKGEMCSDNESLLIIKTKKSLVDRIKDDIRSLHPYEVPEIIAVDIQDGLNEYLQWISDSTI